MNRSEFTVAGAFDYNRSGPIRWIMSHVWRYRPFVLGALVLRTFSLIAYSSAPVFIGQAAEAMTQQGPGASEALAQAAVLVLVALVGDGIVNLLGSLSTAVISNRLEADGREELYRNLLGKSQTFHDRQRVGDIMARATDDVKNLNDLINPGVVLVFEAVLAILIPLTFIGLIRLELLLVPLIFIAAYIVLLKDYVRRLNPVSYAQREAYGTMSSRLEETVSGIETVKASAQEGFEQQKFKHNAGAFRLHFIKQGRIEASYLPLLAYGAATGLTFLHALLLYQQGTVSLAGVIAVTGLLNVLSFPVWVSVWSFSLIQLGLASARRILGLISAETELDENARGHRAPIKGEISFEGVSFGYEGTDFGVAGVSFHIQPGQTVAIVGQTGSGKSTLTQLVNRTYDVSEGRILVDGIDVRDWDLDALRSQISKIEQDVFLFSRTIRENIAFGRPSATRKEIEEAAQEAQAHEFILSFEEGYETVIGERGTTLSGGQRQRIALARAFLSNPRILILDDSTSAIDSATEDEIQRAIQRARQGRTTLLITHRLSQIRWADTILVLDKGSVVAQGTHDDLLRRSELYRRIFARYDIALPQLEGEAVSAS